MTVTAQSNGLTLDEICVFVNSDFTNRFAFHDKNYLKAEEVENLVNFRPGNLAMHLADGNGQGPAEESVQFAAR